MRWLRTNVPASSPVMSDGTLTWRALWDQTSARTGRPQARWLCEVASGYDGEEFLGMLEAPATERAVAHLDAMLARLQAGEPLQYVLGRWGFRQLDLMVDRRVLIPRPETELVVEVALDLAMAMPPPIVCVDLGTGSGAIGLSLAAELPLEHALVWMTDQSEDALDVARANAAGVGRAAAHVRLAQGSWFDALPPDLRGHVDLIVSNPPYVAEHDAQLDASVRDWEPEGALLGGPDGLQDIRAITADAHEWLRPDGWLVLEIGFDQGEAVRALLQRSGFVDVTIRPDLSGRDRIALARRPSSTEPGSDLTEE